MTRMRMRLALTATGLGALALGAAAALAAPVGLTSVDVAYPQSFDSLSSASTPSTALPDGWAIRETGTGGAADGAYIGGTGSGNGGNTYSFGAAGSADRALGTLRSGTVVPTIGGAFTNATGKTLTQLDLAYSGEQWRLGTAGRGADRLDFQYSLDASDLASGTWTDVDALDFSSPVTTGATGALDGNGNAVAVAGSVTGVSIAPGQTFWIRWSDVDVPGADDGLAVDDLRLTPRTSADLPVLVDCGGGVSTTEGFAGSTQVSARDGDDVVTDIRLVAPPAGVTLSSLQPATARAGTATATVDVADDVAPGTYDVTVEASNDAATPQTGSCTLRVTVARIMPIGEVQGSVPDSSNGTSFRSPFEGSFVTVRGVVTQKTGEGGNGIYLQNTPAAADGDPLSSDGIFVYMGGFTTLIGGYTPVIGDEILVNARVSEFNGMTELTSARFLARSGQGLALAPFAANPPATRDEAARYWERREGMLAGIPAGSTVDSPITLFSSTNDTEFYVVSAESEVGQRADPFARRVFRDAHPLDDDPALFDNGNWYRILVTDEGVKGLFGPGTTLAPVRALQTFAAGARGAVAYSFGKYSVAVDAQPQLGPGVDPSTNAPPQAFDRRTAYSVANFNVENLYDYRDDPNDGCDFAGNSGCPGVSPPFNYVPASQAEYDARSLEIAHQIVDDLHGPDVIAVSEAENQDICTVSGGTLSCGAADDADGRPDTLQELATRIAAIGGPAYDAAFDRDGGDARGIVSAFLFRTDRVQLLPGLAGPAVEYRGEPLAYNADVSNPKALNATLPADVDTSTGVDGSNVFTRAPQVGHFRVWRTVPGLSVFRDLWVVANHFSSGPDGRVGQRREQAAYNAAIVRALQADEPKARIVVAGDLNVYPRPDDPFPPPATSDQLGPLYDAGMVNLFDTAVEQHPSSAYSYVYQGQAQTLDQQFVSAALKADLKAVAEAHVNADWTGGVADDGNRGVSDHDPMLSRWNGRVTLAGLRDLVAYYLSTGQIRLERNLVDRLDRAQRLFAAGQTLAALNQLRAFAQDATHGKPGEIDPAAGRTLLTEALALVLG